MNHVTSKRHGSCDTRFVMFVVLESNKLMFIIDIWYKLYFARTMTVRGTERQSLFVELWRVLPASSCYFIRAYSSTTCWRIFELTLTNEWRKLSSVEIITVLMIFDKWSTITLQLNLSSGSWNCSMEDEVVYSLTSTVAYKPFYYFQ